MRVQRNSYMIVSYKVRHNHDVREFLSSYRYLLQRAIDIIWDNIEWKKKRNRLIPIIPKSKEFKRALRNQLLKDWNYASHYVDSAIKTAYSILNSWRRNYIKGRRGRNKPVVKRKFVRVKETLYRFRDEKIVITIRPRQLYLEFDLSKAWFRKRVEGCGLGELVLKENELIITFRKPLEERRTAEFIGWDLNKCSMDGFSPKHGWIRIDLRHLYHIHRVHEIKRKKAQSKASKKTSLKSIVSKHGRRERNRAKDFIHKLTTQLVRILPNATHGFENLDKLGMYSRSKKHNRDVAKQNWKLIIQYMSYKSKVKLVNPKGTSSTCPRCGDKVMKLRKGQVVRCMKCGLTLDRQLCGAINIYLRMKGFPPSPSIFYRVVIKSMISLWKVRMKGGRGVTPIGDKDDDMLPMNPRGELSPMNPKAYIGIGKPM
ncbi:MAG: transposase [Thermofilum sp. ex4484_82]|nr:MAG: transposase [Thermofilum sp. ex4484_82]OYT40160.1 MAG: transposase [Archaeoglobales archaeon ex4484_92]